VTDAAAPEAPPKSVHAVVVVTQLDAPTQRALQFAEAMRTRSLVALNVCLDAAESRVLLDAWARRRIDVPLTSVYPMRGDADPVLRYVDRLRRDDPDGVVMVVLPVVAAARWRQRLLHRLPDPTLGRRLSRLDRVMVAKVPWQLRL
jgi:hypothetical protein